MSGAHCKLSQGRRDGICDGVNLSPWVSVPGLPRHTCDASHLDLILLPPSASRIFASCKIVLSLLITPQIGDEGYQIGGTRRVTVMTRMEMSGSLGTGHNITTPVRPHNLLLVIVFPCDLLRS
jgi:hypothetical protein